MGSETNSPTPSPSGKRSRDPEDEVYIDNLHSHKRYLSEMMASSLNCLTVGDPIPDNLLDSPARSDSMFYSRDEMSLQYSPMSEDLDDARYYETPMSACSSQSESRPTSPVSPYRYKPVGAFCPSPPPSTSQPVNGCSTFSSGSSQPRQRGSDTEGRFPSSPSDICHSGDLRKTALLRSVQMRSQPSCSSTFDLGLGFTAAQEVMQNVESETRSCSFLKPLDDERVYHDHDEGCPVMPSSEPIFDEGKDSMGLTMSEGERSVE
ncbi:hypothetical protein SOVF_001200 isoform A [Spinacia oleracea]|uniref:Uncharacterized protein n=1 Tax=Spinacia oleracea TaxID=3562 RepID=A0ABM3QN73_SPIOL|nr:uncharacterized protein LOC110777298 [Spinacia oleracea]KNA26054.1 hypothetical protein SOVF_001200 isoform A [Spinacia oleracea]